jgi:hypothetical protein
MKNTLTYEVSAQCTDFHIFHDNLHPSGQFLVSHPAQAVVGIWGNAFSAGEDKNVARIFRNHTLL